jgi:hypothetical protein
MPKDRLVDVTPILAKLQISSKVRAKQEGTGQKRKGRRNVALF